jgi:hypothetical protein
LYLTHTFFLESWILLALVLSQEKQPKIPEHLKGKEIFLLHTSREERKAL